MVTEKDKNEFLKRVKAQQEERRRTYYTPQSPRYDDVYFKGLAALNGDLGMDKETEDFYEVIFENKASLTLQAENIKEALDAATESLLGCLPENFNPKNLVRPILVRNLRYKEEIEK